MNKFLVIQTSFIGDVILATALLEKLHVHYNALPIAIGIDICVRQGNEQLFIGHPYLGQVHIWNKKKSKFKNLLQLQKQIKQEQYDVVINLQRFASSGFLTAFSGAKEKIGFKKNPLSVAFTRSFKHEISAQGTKHEVDRNQKLIEHLTDAVASKPKLYPSENDFLNAKKIVAEKKYITISPASVWFTKQLPFDKWVELINKTSPETQIFILGGPGDKELGEQLMSKSGRVGLTNLAGELSLLGSAALMRDAQMNYVNDSAPLHLCSALNAPVTAFFCSTVPAFGFTPLADNTTILESSEKLDCRPCGLHGYKDCPKGHFKCGNIDLSSDSR